MADDKIESLLTENRLFEPEASFCQHAHIKSRAESDKIREQALADPETFWSDIAAQLHWFTPWSKVLDWQPPFARWFVGGKTNLSYNCLDRQIEAGNGAKTAILWEGEPGDKRRLTYAELLEEVCRFAGALRGLGVSEGDRVAIYMPMVPEAAVAMLACARIGAAHSIVFGGFAA